LVLGHRVAHGKLKQDEHRAEHTGRAKWHVHESRLAAGGA
jgi:hypothetical protein